MYYVFIQRQEENVERCTFFQKPALLLVSHLCDSSITQNSLRFARPETWKTSLLILHPQDLSSQPTTYVSNLSPFFLYQ